jgi:ABC-type sugar transport system permease subunit
MMRQVRDDPTWFLPQMIYEEAFSRLRFGVAAAVTVSWLVITGVLFFLAFRFVRSWGYADEL